MVAEEKKDPKISNEVRDLSTKIENELQISELGNVTANGDVYYKFAPENLNKEVIDNVFNYDSLHTKGLTLAVGNIAVKAFTGNNNLQNVDAVISQVGNNNTSVHVKREHVTNNAFTDNKDVISYGNTRVIKQVEPDTDKGEMKRVLVHIKDEARDALIKK